MLIKNKSTFSEFFRRLKFYAFGFLLGLILVVFLFKDRTVCKMPGSLKIEEIQKQQIEYSKHASCRMECRQITADNIKEIIQEGKINYSKSNAQDVPCPTYAVEGFSKDGKHLRIVVADCDTISKIVTAIDLELENDTCACR